MATLFRVFLLELFFLRNHHNFRNMYDQKMELKINRVSSKLKKVWLRDSITLCEENKSYSASHKDVNKNIIVALSSLSPRFLKTTSCFEDEINASFRAKEHFND